MMAVNVYTMQRIFSLLTNVTLTEYIRKRRLSLAGFDLFFGKMKVIDVAVKYQYNNATSFSRAFTLFHGIKPGEVKRGKGHLRDFPRITFDLQSVEKIEMEYEVVELEEFVLYGDGVKTTDGQISKDAPAFFERMSKMYEEKYGAIDYGMICYEERFHSLNYEYWVLWNKKINEFKKIVIPRSKWLVFPIYSVNASQIQKVSHDFYYKFLPSCKYNLRDIPELEYYHNGMVSFLVPIE